MRALFRADLEACESLIGFGDLNGKDVCVENFFMEAQEFDFQMGFEEGHLVFDIISDESGDHRDQTAGENVDGKTTEVFVNFRENVALNSEHESYERNHLNHVVEVFFAGKWKRCGLTHAFLSENRKKT